MTKSECLSQLHDIKYQIGRLQIPFYTELCGQHWVTTSKTIIIPLRETRIDIKPVVDWLIDNPTELSEPIKGDIQQLKEDTFLIIEKARMMRKNNLIPIRLNRRLINLMAPILANIRHLYHYLPQANPQDNTSPIQGNADEGNNQHKKRGAGRRVITFPELAANGLLQPLTGWMRTYIGENKKFIAAIKVAVDNGWLTKRPSYRSLTDHFKDIGMREDTFNSYFRTYNAPQVLNHHINTVFDEAQRNWDLPTIND